MVVCYVCLDVRPEATISPCLFSPLPTSASEFKWLNGLVLCMCEYLTRSNLFLFLLYACFIANISWWDLLNDLVLCMCQCLTRSNLFLFLSAQSIANISEWVLMNGPVLHMCECLTRSNLFLSLSACSIANIRRWVFLNCLVLCMCMWIFDQKYNLLLSCLLVSLPILAGEFYWMILCCAHVCMFDQK